VYATRAEAANAVRVRDIIKAIKGDKIDPLTRRPYVEIVVERMAASVGASLEDILNADSVLIPVPGSGLTRPNTVWPALSICNALRKFGLGAAIETSLRRAHAVQKSAGNQTRPSLEEHYKSFSVQGTLTAAKNLTLIDDVVTSGTTLMAAREF